MRIGRVLYPIKALGPGERLGIWVSGCERRCPGCANPELWSKEGREVMLPILLSMCRAAVKDYRLSGITITGGEPLLQAEELTDLLEGLDGICKDILLFTGYTMEEIKGADNPHFPKLLSHVSVLVDGEYIQERNEGDLLRGSSNQVIHYLDETVKAKYEAYLRTDRRIIDSFAAEDGIVSVGIHPVQFMANER
jgi:anaerobic ribonucleoside-triphosphate reductase activating protein